MTSSEMVQAGKQAEAQSLLDGVARRPGSRAQILLLGSLPAGADPDGKAATSEYDLTTWSV
jgi:hypothetical protein